MLLNNTSELFGSRTLDNKSRCPSQCAKDESVSCFEGAINSYPGLRGSHWKTTMFGTHFEIHPYDSGRISVK